jgi:tetratricopeptide (TPR) repeat protein
VSATIDHGGSGASPDALEDAGRHEEAARAWEALAEGRSGAERAVALCQQARLLFGPLGRTQQAIRVYRRAFENDPENPEVLDALFEHATSSGDWPLLGNVARHRFRSEGEPHDRVELALAAGLNERQRLHSPGGARAWFQAGLALDPDHVGLHEALADLERERGDDVALLSHLERVIELRADEPSPAVLLEAASLHADRGTPLRALGYLERASQLAPEDSLVLDALAEVLTELDRPTDLADVLERRAAIAGDDPLTRASVLAELGELLEQRLFDLEAALDAYERAHAADPEADDVATALTRLRAKVESGVGRTASASPEAAAASVAAEAVPQGIEPEAPAPTGDPAVPEDPDAALAALEREAAVTHDRGRLAEVVRDIARIHRERGSPREALPWVQRWVVAAPENAEALRSLAGLLDETSETTQLCATLETLDPLLGADERLPTRRRLGALYARAGQLDAAAVAYERALAADPTDVEALEGRCSVLRRQNRPAELAAALWQLADLLEPRRRAATLAELCQVQAEIGDLPGAIETYARLEREDDAPSDVADRLDALLAKAERFEVLEARLRERAGEYDPGSAEAVALDLRRATLLLDKLERPEEAAEVFQSVLIHAPESPKAKAGLERTLRSSIDASGLAGFLAEQAEHATDPLVRSRSAFERAVILEELLERPDEARDVFRDLAEQGSEPQIRVDASRRYERLLERTGEWPALRAHLEGSLGRGTPAEDEDLHERLARLCAVRLHDEAGELRHLERVVELNPERRDVWRQLTDRYEHGGRTEDLIRALEAELTAGVDGARELTVRSRLAELYLGADPDPQRAAVHYERLFELNPAHTTAARFLTELYEREGRPADVVRVLEARLVDLGAREADAQSDESDSLRTSLRIQIARVRESQLDDLEGAISALEIALGEAGPCPSVAVPLAEAYERAGYSLDLIELCQGAAAASADPGERGNWLVRLGDAFLARDRTQEAAHAYRQALAERPDDRVVQASLRELYRQGNDTGPLARLLDAELAHLAGPSEVPVRLELAQLLSEERPEDSLLHARRILQLEPDHPEAFECAVAAAGRLDQHEAALQLVRKAIERSQSRSRRADLLARAATLLAGPLARSDDAADAYREALELDPTRRGLRAELAALLERCERWPEMLACLELEARDASDAQRASLLEKGALIAWDRIAPDAALPWLERLRRERPDDPSVLWRIAEVHREQGRTESLLRTLGAELAITSDPTRQRELHLERAKLLGETLGSPGRALVALGDALALDPSDAGVLERLEHLQKVQGLHAERATTLEAMLATTDGAARIPLHRELAELCAGPLVDLERATHHWRAALALVPRGSAAKIELLRALADAHRAAGRTEEWATYAEQELAALEPTPVFDDRRRELRRALALAYDAELGRPDASLQHLRALLDAGEDALLGVDVVQQLEDIALRLLRAEGDPIELEARLAQRLARDAEDPDGWLELARLREERLLTTSGALEAYRRVLDLEPTSRPALRGLRACAERLGRWAEVAEALEVELDHPDAQASEERGPLLRRLGDVCWHRLQSTTRASRAYAGALEVDGADFASLRALERLLEAMEDWRGALDLYESEVEVLGDRDPTRRHEVWLRVAALARDRTHEVERARRAYARAAEIEPLAAGDLYAFAMLHDRAGDREAFARDFAAWCDLDSRDATCADHVRLAECLESLDRREEALARIERAVTLDARDPAAWDVAARLRDASGNAAGSADALRRAAALASDTGAAERLTIAAARLEPEDGAGALELLREAATRAPGALPVHCARARLAAALGLHEEAEESAGRALDLSGERPLDPETRIAVALIGGDAARASGHLESAGGFYAGALAIDPDCPAANAAYGETLAALGDHPAARAALETRLARGDDYPERGRHLAIVGRCLEADGRLDEALDAYERSLGADPRVEEALEAAVRVRVALDRIDEGIAALERWAAAATGPGERAARLLRAAEWELASGERAASAERHLRDALAADPDLAGAWTALIRMLLDAGRLGEAIEAADRSAVHLPDDAQLAAVALLQARAHEQAGDRPEAADAFGVAAQADPRCTEAALARARLLRGFGEWRGAAETLEAFVANHPDARATELAAVHEQLARLLAGPLEDVEGAVTNYRRAVALDAERREARAALAELLSHRPGDWDEALSHQRLLFEDDPADATSLRVALRIARGRGDPHAIATGTTILQALGAASPYETVDIPDGATAPSGAVEPRLELPLHETLRQVAMEAAGEIGEALEAPGAVPQTPLESGDPEAAFRAAVLDAEGRLSAPALLPLPTRELGEVLTLVATLILDPDRVHGDGRLVNALSSALRRRLRRRLKRALEGVSLAAVREVDFEAWRADLRGLAAATVLRETGCDLRTAFVTLVRDAGEAELDLRESADLSAVVAGCPTARGLLRRVVREWLAGL